MVDGYTAGIGLVKHIVSLIYEGRWVLGPSEKSEQKPGL